MRGAYALLGLAWLIVIGALVVINDNFMQKGDTDVNARAAMTPPTLILTSPAFGMDAAIPPRYTCDGENTPPPLAIGGAPEGTRSFVLIVEDPDVPLVLKPDGKYLHWVLFDIPAGTTEIGAEGSHGVHGQNDAGADSYTGPCPPKEYEPSEHRYVFSLYALDQMLGLRAGASRDEVVQAMQGHILGEAQLIGRYKKQ